MANVNLMQLRRPVIKIDCSINQNKVKWPRKIIPLNKLWKSCGKAKNEKPRAPKTARAACQIAEKYSPSNSKRRAEKFLRQPANWNFKIHRLARAAFGANSAKSLSCNFQ